ncbi:MAG: HigA family addiction module antitoxin [Caldilineaceae bacterium]
MQMKNPSHPGEIIRDCLTDLELTVTDAALALGITRSNFSKILNGRAGVSPEMAIRLSKAFGSTPAFWLRLQLNYDLAQAEKNSDRIKVNRIEKVAA